jgi:hypothetical protein
VALQPVRQPGGQLQRGHIHEAKIVSRGQNQSLQIENHHRGMMVDTKFSSTGQGLFVVCAILNIRRWNFVTLACSECLSQRGGGYIFQLFKQPVNPLAQHVCLVNPNTRSIG